METLRLMLIWLMRVQADESTKQSRLIWTRWKPRRQMFAWGFLPGHPSGKPTLAQEIMATGSGLHLGARCPTLRAEGRRPSGQASRGLGHTGSDKDPDWAPGLLETTVCMEC